MTDLRGQQRQLYDTVRHAVVEHSRIPNAALLDDDQDLFLAGMGSHANVAVMLAIEESLALEFPDEMLNPATFRTISHLTRCVSSLLGEQA